MIRKKISCRVYLEGIRIPFYSVTVTMRPNSVGVLRLVLPPLREIFDVLPRTIVQVFYDTGDGLKSFFEGEVVGHSFMKDPVQGRHMELVCMDLSNYWRYSYAHYLHRVDTIQYSLEDTVLFFTGAQAAQVVDRKETEKVAPIRGVGQEAHKLLQRSDKDLVTGITNIFKLIRDVNSFYTERFDALKINDRLFNLPDGQLQLLLDPTAIDGAANLISNQESFVPVLDVLNILLQSLYQQFWSVSLPSMSAEANSKPVSFMTIPVTFLTAPPRCNVIFPDLHEGFNYSRNYLDEPTRMEVYSGSSNEGLTKQFAYAPEAFRKKIEEIREAQIQNKDLRTQNLIIESDNPEFDESSRGITPARQALMQDGFASVRSALFRQKGEDESRKKLERFKQEIADFEFTLRKFSGRTLPVSMAFNPNIHPAFPILLVDNEANLFASPAELTHVIDAKGIAKTMIKGIYARHKDVVGDFTLPPWINKSFVPEAIGEDTFSFTDEVTGQESVVSGAYPQLLGADMRSILSDELDIPVGENPDGTVITEFRKPESQEEAADAIFHLYQTSGDRESLIEGFTERKIMTLEESLDFLDVTELNDDELEGDLYDPDKRSIIEEIKTKLVLAGFAIVEI